MVCEHLLRGLLVVVLDVCVDFGNRHFAPTKQWKSFALCIASNWAVPTLIDRALTDCKFSSDGWLVGYLLLGIFQRWIRSRYLAYSNLIFSYAQKTSRWPRRAGQWWWELSFLNWKSWWCLFSDPLVLCFITEEFENQPSYCSAAAVHVSLEQFPPLPSCNLPPNIVLMMLDAWICTCKSSPWPRRQTKQTSQGPIDQSLETMRTSKIQMRFLFPASMYLFI